MPPGSVPIAPLRGVSSAQWFRSDAQRLAVHAAEVAHLPQKEMPQNVKAMQWSQAQLKTKWAAMLHNSREKDSRGGAPQPRAGGLSAGDVDALEVGSGSTSRSRSNRSGGGDDEDEVDADDDGRTWPPPMPSWLEETGGDSRSPPSPLRAPEGAGWKVNLGVLGRNSVGADSGSARGTAVERSAKQEKRLKEDLQNYKRMAEEARLLSHATAETHRLWCLVVAAETITAIEVEESANNNDTSLVSTPRVERRWGDAPPASSARVLWGRVRRLIRQRSVTEPGQWGRAGPSLPNNAKGGPPLPRVCVRIGGLPPKLADGHTVAAAMQASYGVR
jgi:hypothetical protein